MRKNSILSIVAVAVFLLSGTGIAVAAELALLTWKGYAPVDLVEKFQKETGITVKVTYSNNEEMIAKLRATRGAGFDLAQPSQDRISSVQQQFKIYQPIDLSKIDAKQIIPSMLEAVKQNTMVGGKPHAVPFCWGTSGLVVNRKYAPNASDYSDLLNAFYNGRISYRLKRPTLIALAFAAGENPFAKYGNEKAYEDLMKRIETAMIAAKPFVKSYWTNGDALLESMRSGEVQLAMAWDAAGWKLLAEDPNIDFVAAKRRTGLDRHICHSGQGQKRGGRLHVDQLYAAAGKRGSFHQCGEIRYRFQRGKPILGSFGSREF